MTVAFSGNVINDFPAATGPGVKFLTGGAVEQPVVPVDLEDLITVTGFNLEGIALSYDPVGDELYVGILQPGNGTTTQRVIAGDTDNNLNSATVAPDVKAVDSNFEDFPDLLSTEGMGVYFDLNADGTPDIIAGIQPDNPFGNKQFQVARAVVVPFTTRPDFGAELPGYAGNFYLVNSPNHPAMEFSISRFSELYQNVMGSPLTTTQNMAAGAFGKPASISRISEANYRSQPYSMQDVSPAADLAIRKLDNPNPVRVGDTLVYTLIVNNLGPFDNDQVNVSDLIQPGVNVISITPSQGSVLTNPSGFTANLGTIAAGGSASITVVTKPTITGDIRNSTVVTSGNPWIRDPNPANNTSEVLTKVLGPIVCPPILVNPHEAGVINTAHDTFIRVNVYGTSQLDVESIDPSTVNLSGAQPIGYFKRYLNGDQLPDITYIFMGSDAAFDALPRGYATVALAGSTNDGSSFDAGAIVFNVDEGCFGQVRARDIKKFAGDLVHEIRALNPPLRLVDVIDVNRIPAKGPFRARAIEQLQASSGLNAQMQARSGLNAQALGSSTVRIPGVRAARGNRINVVNPVDDAPITGVKLGSSVVQIPFVSGKTGPIVIDNASKIGEATTRRIIPKATPTVKIARGMTRQASVGAKLASSIEDFTLYD